MLARAHLRRCAPCTAKWREIQSDCARTAALLGLHAMHPDTDEAWERFTVRSGGSPAQSGWVLPRRDVAAAGVVVALISQTVRTELVTRMYRLSAQVSPASKSPTQRNRAFAQSLAVLEARAVYARRVSDVCCADRDGEGHRSNGVLTVQLNGSRSPVVILYEDTDRAGRFEPGDVVLDRVTP